MQSSNKQRETLSPNAIALREAFNAYFEKKTINDSNKYFIENIIFSQDKLDCLEGFLQEYAHLSLNVYRQFEALHKDINKSTQEEDISLSIKTVLALSSKMTLSALQKTTPADINAIEDFSSERKKLLCEQILKLNQPGVCDSAMQFIELSMIAISTEGLIQALKKPNPEHESDMQSAINKKVEDYKTKHGIAFNAIMTPAINTSNQPSPISATNVTLATRSSLMQRFLSLFSRHPHSNERDNNNNNYNRKSQE